MIQTVTNFEHINPAAIHFDESNPRGMSPKQITTDPEFVRLVASIATYGILEPLIVKPSGKRDNYILIDGERRLRAALKAEIKKVPVLITSGDFDGRILAYQVHMLRQIWTKAAETKAIRKIIADLREEEPDITEAEIKRKVIDITAHKSHEIGDILKLTKYDNVTIEEILENKLKMSYLVQIESNFMKLLQKHFPEIIIKHTEAKIRKTLIDKAIENKLGNTRYLMDHFRQVFSDGDHKNEVRKLLTTFLTKKSIDIVTVYEEYKQLQPSQHETTDKVVGKIKSTKAKTKLPNKAAISRMSINISKKELSKIDDVRTKIESIGNLFGQEEVAYLSEALQCLESHCFKAALLMAWSAGISRILKYVQANLVDYMKCSNDMISSPKSFYKHFTGNFIKKAASVDEIRECSNDRQLLCYMGYKKYISATEFQKLHSIYSIRNNCAHPTDIKISSNEIISIFDNIHDHILSNKALL